MRSVVQGEGATFDIQLDPAADADSVTWTLRDATGSPLAGAVGVSAANPPGALQVSLAVPAQHHVALGGRFLTVSWASGGNARQIYLSYRVTRWFPLTATASDVRGVYGLNGDAELPDGEIDLVAAAEMVEISNPNLLAHLAEPGVVSVQANRAVVLRAALNLAASIQLRAAESMSSDSVSFTRFRGANLSKLIESVQGEYGDLLQTLRGGTPVIPTLFVLTARDADPITGA